MNLSSEGPPSPPELGGPSPCPRCGHPAEEAVVYLTGNRLFLDPPAPADAQVGEVTIVREESPVVVEAVRTGSKGEEQHRRRIHRCRP